MIDIVLEITRALILLGLILYLWRVGLKHHMVSKNGWRLVLIGFCLLLLGCVLDVTDNFPSLNRFVIIGQTNVQGFFENIVGYTLGFIFLTFGLIMWIPVLRESSGQIDQHPQSGRDLSTSRKKELNLDGKPEIIVQEPTKRNGELLQRIEIEKMEASEQVAACLAHKINNPLAGIKNAFLLVKNGVPEDYQHYHYIERIEKEIERIASVLRQKLGVHRMESDGLMEHDIRVSLNKAIILLASDIEEHGVAITQTECTHPLIVAIPEGLLRKVLFNVILNAIQASPDSGEINVIFESIEDRLTILVIDQGNGIPDDLKEKVFKPFFSAKLGNSGGGLGLGLPNSLAIVQSWNGSIDIKTDQDQSTIVRIQLPLFDKSD